LGHFGQNSCFDRFFEEIAILGHFGQNSCFDRFFEEYGQNRPKTPCIWPVSAGYGPNTGVLGRFFEELTFLGHFGQIPGFDRFFEKHAQMTDIGSSRNVSGSSRNMAKTAGI